MYKSPIDVFLGQIEVQREGEVLKAVQKCGVDVDKDELVKALAYDREYKNMQTNNWIPVSERLPESGVKVLISCWEFDEPSIGWYNSDPEYSEWYGEYKLSEHRDVHVTHWMPLPELPKGEC